MSKNIIIGLILFISILSFGTAAFAQTSSFVYQGKLQDGGSSANGTYQFEFKLFDAASGGNQIGQTLSGVSATVTGGIFAVNLDFGAASYDGAPRFLEIGVRLNNSGQAYTLLNPRQPVTATPYAVKSLKADEANTAVTANNSLNLGGVPAAQYVVTTDSRMSDARNPLPGSINYIQNTVNQQTSSNFNITGEGKADKFSATTQFNIGTNRVLSATGSGNLFAGVGAGTNNTAGATNNSFFGSSAGQSNTSGDDNSFFGHNAGFANTTGGSNSFFGNSAGLSNVGGSSNAFFGGAAGLLNTSGSFNTFIGRNTAFSNTTGNSNTFVGYGSGGSVTNGTDNVFLGANSGSTGNVSNSIAIGSNVKVATSNTALIGNANTDVQIPGDLIIGKTTTLGGKLTVSNGNIDVTNGSISALSASFDGEMNANSVQAQQGNIASLLTTSAILNGMTFVQKLKISISNPTTGYTDDLCIAEDDHTVRRCVLWFAEMKNVQEFSGGLNVIKNLRPVTFNEGDSSQKNVGLMFADTNAATSLFAKRDNTTNAVTGVRQREIVTALVGAAQEQQTQIERQQEQIKQLQAQLDALKALLCQSNSNVTVCQK